MVNIILPTNNKSNQNDYEEYQKLEIKNVSSIIKTDLPSEFSEEAFKIVDEFIRKTIDLNHEILLYFDYITGEIIKCKIGTSTNVKLEFNEDEFNEKNIASIHNHTKDMYTPPSEKNFGIFLRNWEKYELIAGFEELWILKGKLKNEKLFFELKFISNLLFNIAFEDSLKTTETNEDRDKKCDENYGALLSKYINNKNLNEIQLIKREYKND